MLSDDVKLQQASRPQRAGRADVAKFFTFYEQYDPVRLVPAKLDDREVIAVFDPVTELAPVYFMWLEWRDGLITFIHDYRYTRYVAADADFVLVDTAGS